jgi:hypothetical protein
MALTLQAKASTPYVLHPEGIFAALCIDVMDLGAEEVEFQGVKSMKDKLRITFETDTKMEDGKPYTISKKFTSSLASKSNLNAFLAKWRGKAIGVDETIDLTKLIGANCTLVISHAQSQDGQKTYSNIDAISKPTKKLTPSGCYDAAAARQRHEDWKAKQTGGGFKPTPTPAAKPPVQDPKPAPVDPPRETDDDVPF